jgi:hypothetical protein
MSCDLLAKNTAFKLKNKGEIVENSKIETPEEYKGPDIHIVNFVRYLLKKYPNAERISVTASVIYQD